MTSWPKPKSTTLSQRLLRVICKTWGRLKWVGSWQPRVSWTWCPSPTTFLWFGRSAALNCIEKTALNLGVQCLTVEPRFHAMLDSPAQQPSLSGTYFRWCAGLHSSYQTQILLLERYNNSCQNGSATEVRYMDVLDFVWPSPILKPLPMIYCSPWLLHHRKTLTQNMVKPGHRKCFALPRETCSFLMGWRVRLALGHQTWDSKHIAKIVKENTCSSSFSANQLGNWSNMKGVSYAMSHAGTFLAWCISYRIKAA